MTADEISFAGGVYNTNAPAWYYYNAAGTSVVDRIWWWTMSPATSSGNYSSAFHVDGDGSSNPGHLYNCYVYYLRGVRPVLSLKSCVLTSSGDGTSDNPYRVNVSNICLNEEN